MKTVVKPAVLLISAFALLGCSEPVPQEDAFRVVMVQKVDKSDWQGIRYNRYTGEAWYATSGTWEKINDEDDRVSSVYEVKMVSMNQNWGAIRLDVHSGESWRARNGAWVEMPIGPEE